MRRFVLIVSAALALGMGAAGVARGADAPAVPAGDPPMPMGEAARGQTLWESRCTGCHSLDADRVGPRHRGVYGRTAGTLPSFKAYSPAAKASGIVWSEATLDAWLTNPQAFIPGQRMNFRIGNAQERADIIAFLKRESGPDAQVKKP